MSDADEELHSALNKTRTRQTAIETNDCHAILKNEPETSSGLGGKQSKRISREVCVFLQVAFQLRDKE